MNPHAMEQAKRGAARSGVSNVTYDLVSVFNNLLEGIAAMETYKEDADEAGDNASLAFFTEWQETTRGQIDRVRDLLTARIASAS